jgi:hypothetical protein
MDFNGSPSSRAGTACRRGAERYRILYSGEAFVEWVGPEGRTWKLELLGLSSRGVCFGLQDGQPILERGSRLGRVVVQIGGARIEGRLLVAHATEEFAAGTICGAEFQPASESDERKLNDAIAALGW